MALILSDVLHHHGVAGNGDTLTDNAREAGIIYACLGCGSVGGINPDDGEVARRATRDALDQDYLCCEDASQVIF